MGDECGGDSVGVEFVVIGMVLCALASVGSTFGLILQKKAQTENEALPENKKYKTSGAVILSPTWLLGLVLLVLVPFPLDLVAFSLAPQSLVVPLTGLTLVLNQVIAPYMLDEKVGWMDWVATMVIVVGIVLATAFGVHCSKTYNLDQLIGLFDALLFQLAEALFVVSMIVSWWWTQSGAQRFYEGEACDRARAAVYGYAAGAVGGQQQIFLKASGELLESTFNGDGQWGRYEGYFILVTCLLLAVVQIQLLNQGLGLWSAVKYLPLYNVCLILCSTSYGSIYYQEYKGLSTLGIVMFPVGVAVIVSGAIFMSVFSKEASNQITDEKAATGQPNSSTRKALLVAEASLGSLAAHPGAHLSALLMKALPSPAVTQTKQCSFCLNTNCAHTAPNQATGISTSPRRPQTACSSWLEQQREAQIPNSAIAAEADEAKSTCASAPHARESLPDEALPGCVPHQPQAAFKILSIQRFEHAAT